MNNRIWMVYEIERNATLDSMNPLMVTNKIKSRKEILDYYNDILLFFFVSNVSFDFELNKPETKDVRSALYVLNITSKVCRVP